jgi:predicted aldo/keto reductase-like oxidoreductase
MNKKKIIIGTAQSDPNYGIIKSNNFIKIIKLIKKNKFFLDTAIVYKNSDVFFNKIGKDYDRIINKIPFIEKNEKFEKTLIQKLKKIYVHSNSKKLYGILLHDPSIILNSRYRRIILNQIRNLKNKNLLKKFGISVYSVAELNKILKVFTPEIIQLPVNIINQSFLEKNLLRSLKKKKIEIHARSIFLQGILLQNYENIPDYFKNKKPIKKYFEFINIKKVSPLKFCLKFLSNIKEIDKFVVGFNDLNQLRLFLNFLKKIDKFKMSLKTYNNFKSTDLNLIDPRKWKKND